MIFRKATAMEVAHEHEAPKEEDTKKERERDFKTATEHDRKKMLHEGKPHRHMLEKKPYEKTGDWLKACGFCSKELLHNIINIGEEELIEVKYEDPVAKELTHARFFGCPRPELLKSWCLHNRGVRCKGTGKT